MPELPDVDVYVEHVAARTVGHALERVRLASPFVLRTASPPLQVAGYVPGSTGTRFGLPTPRGVVTLGAMSARPWPAMSGKKERAPSFFAGLASFFGGIGFIVGRPAMWRWALVPTLVATVLFFGLGAGAVWGGSELAARIVTGDDGWITAGLWLLRVLFWMVGLVMAYLVAITFAQPLSGFALDTIARRQELALGGRSWPDQPFFPSALRSLRVTLTALVLSLPLVVLLGIITFFVPPASVVTVPLKFVVTGLAIAYDMLDYPLGLRGAGVRARVQFIADNFAAVLGFGLAAALMLLVPGLGLVVLPFGVAGATRLVIAADRASGLGPESSCEPVARRATTVE